MLILIYRVLCVFTRLQGVEKYGKEIYHMAYIQNEQYTLQHAIEEGFVDGVRRLLLFGVITTDEDFDPLVYATQLGHYAIVRLLLIAGSDPNTQSGSAIIEAARLNDITVADLLWRAGADITILDDAPSRVAQAEGNQEMVFWLQQRKEQVKLHVDR